MGICYCCYFRSPRKPNVALSFCYWAFPAENCCLPGFDTDMAYYYTTLVETSDSCAYLETENRLALKYWFCYGCAKQQPAHLKTLGERLDGLNTYTLHEISVCPSFAKKLYPEQFDECGLIIPGDRESECFGDDTVIPSQHWGTGEAGALAFMNDDVGGKPPFFENTDEDRFVVVVSGVIFLIFLQLFTLCFGCRLRIMKRTASAILLVAFSVGYHCLPHYVSQ